MITMKINQDDVQYHVEGKTSDILAEVVIVFIHCIKLIRSVKDDDRLVDKLIDIAVEKEKELEE